jgi:hypothetical protein
VEADVVFLSGRVDHNNRLDLAAHDESLEFVLVGEELEKLVNDKIS